MAEFCLCLRENDKNLMHVLSAEELDKPFYDDYYLVGRAKNEEKAFEAVADLVKDFCELFWDKGQTPDFRKFKAWVWRVKREK